MLGSYPCPNSLLPRRRQISLSGRYFVSTVCPVTWCQTKFVSSVWKAFCLAIGASQFNFWFSSPVQRQGRVCQPQDGELPLLSGLVQPHHHYYRLLNSLRSNSPTTPCLPLPQVCPRFSASMVISLPYIPHRRETSLCIQSRPTSGGVTALGTKPTHPCLKPQW